MKLWIDDIREKPNGFDLHVRTAQEAIEIIKHHPCSAISFDHDLGSEDCGTGYHVAQWIENQAFDHSIQRMGWTIHSANPVGRKNITMAMENAECYWDEMDEKFLKLFKKWREETGYLSNMVKAAKNANHLAMVAMGLPVVGTILRLIHQEPEHLFLTLRYILQGGPVIPMDDRGNIERMSEIWYDWGVKEGYIHEKLS